MQKFRRFVGAFIRWILDAWRVWCPILVVALVLVLASFLTLPHSERMIRLCGLAFQLFGIVTVIEGLRGRRRLFNRPSLFESVGKWFRGRPRWTPKSQTVSVSGVGAVMFAGNVTAFGWCGAAVNASVEDRLAALEVNAESLRKRQDETADELRKANANLSDAVAKERDERGSALAGLRLQIDNLGAGSLHIEMMGIYWVIAGTVLATVPAELAVLLNGLW